MSNQYHNLGWLLITLSNYDFPSLAESVAVPHTLYDMERNEAYVNIGTSRDTSQFSCDSIRHWWYAYGSLYYPLATSILMLMEGGGSNSSRHLIFKKGFTGFSGRNRH